MGTVLLLAGIIMAFIINFPVLMAKTEKYKFYRGIVYARDVSLLFYSVMIMSTIGMIVTNIIAGRMYFNYSSIILDALGGVLFIALSILGYVLKGEGIYQSGLLMNGMFFRYSDILSYYFLDTEVQGIKTFCFFTRSCLGEDMLKTAALPLDAVEKLDEELCIQGIIKSDE